MAQQELLTFLFDAMPSAVRKATIAISFIAIAAVDLSREIIALYKQVFVVPQLPSPERQPQPLSQLPEEWLLPVAEAVAPAQIAQVQPKPVLLLAPAKTVEEVQSGKAYAARCRRRYALRPCFANAQGPSHCTVEKPFFNIDVDTLTLRQARKIAKALGIAQKVNGRDQKLDFLRSQIQAKLQQKQLMKAELVAS